MSKWRGLRELVELLVRAVPVEEPAAVVHAARLLVDAVAEHDAKRVEVGVEEVREVPSSPVTRSFLKAGGCLRHYMECLKHFLTLHRASKTLFDST